MKICFFIKNTLSSIVIHLSMMYIYVEKIILHIFLSFLHLKIIIGDE